MYSVFFDFARINYISHKTPVVVWTMNATATSREVGLRLASWLAAEALIVPPGSSPQFPVIARLWSPEQSLLGETGDRDKK